MKLLIPTINIIFGVVSAIGIGQFANIGGRPTVIFAAEVVIGIAVGIIATIKLKVISIHHTHDLLNIFYLNVSLWFGIAAGFLGLGMVISMGLTLVFSLLFGNPEAKPWPQAVGNSFIVLLVTVLLSSAFLLGKWFFSSTLKYIQNKENCKQ